MGCVSSALLEGDGAGQDDRRRIISLSHHHHVVSLTSSTYGILTSPRAYCSSPSSDSTAVPTTPTPQQQKSAPPPPPPPPPPTARPKPESLPHPQAAAAEVINAWELMAGLIDPSTPAKQQHPSTCRAALCSASSSNNNKSAPDGSRRRRIRFPLRPIDTNSSSTRASASGSAVVLYTTSLRGVRSTFESCNAVRAALQAHGVAFRERDVSMDRGFREELRDLTRGLRLPSCHSLLPRLFVRGRHVGGADEVLRLDEEGLLAPMLDGLPRRVGGGGDCCDGCVGMRFLPCFDCSGSRKVVVTLPPPLPVQEESTTEQKQCSSNRPKVAKGRRTVVVRCGECNENGLVLCPICS